MIKKKIIFLILFKTIITRKTMTTEREIEKQILFLGVHTSNTFRCFNSNRGQRILTHYRTIIVISNNIIVFYCNSKRNISYVYYCTHANDNAHWNSQIVCIKHQMINTGTFERKTNCHFCDYKTVIRHVI